MDDDCSGIGITTTRIWIGIVGKNGRSQCSSPIFGNHSQWWVCTEWCWKMRGLVLLVQIPKSLQCCIWHLGLSPSNHHPPINSSSGLSFTPWGLFLSFGIFKWIGIENQYKPIFALLVLGKFSMGVHNWWCWKIWDIQLRPTNSESLTFRMAVLVLECPSE